jgi:hypothetical protein
MAAICQIVRAQIAHLSYWTQILKDRELRQ